MSPNVFPISRGFFSRFQRACASAPALIAAFAFCLIGLQPTFVSAEEVRLQLKWRHQFQFAGYYAALDQGYYREAGLEVDIAAGGPGVDPIEEVLSGRADFGAAGAELLLTRLNGGPVTVVAVIFQHSPSVLVSLQESGIDSPHDLIGRTVMISEAGEKDLWAMLFNEGLDRDDFRMAETTWDLEELIDGRIDATAAYVTNTPFYLIQKGIPFNLMKARTYGVDFYGDCLFTRQRMAEKHPDTVEAFRRASLKGWQYAMAHPEAVIDLILSEYDTQKSRDHLLYEAQSMRELIMPELIGIGHVNPGRWRHIANVYSQMGMAPDRASLDGFIFDPAAGRDLTWLWWTAAGLGLLAAAILGYAVWLRHFNLRLINAVEDRTAQLSRLNQDLNTEIEERREAERSLRASQEQYRNLVNHFPNGAVVMFDHDLRYTFAGGLGLADAGLDKDQMVGQTIWEVFDPVTCETVAQQYRRALAGRASVDEVPFGDRVYEVRTMPIFGLEEEVAAGMAITQEITARKQLEHELTRRRDLLHEEVQARTKDLEESNQRLRLEIQERLRAQEALSESEARYRTLFETMAQGVVYQDADGKIVSANSSAERILGVRFEDMEGRTWLDPQWRLVREDKTELPGDEHPGMVALKTGQEVRGVILGLFNPEVEDLVWIRINAVPEFKPGQNHPYRAFSTFDDVSQLKGQEEELGLAKMQAEMFTEEIRQTLNLSEAQRLEMEEAKQKAEELAVQAEAANRAKTEFLANIGHELRTPLNPIIGLTDLMLEVAEEPEQARYLNDIKNSAERLLKLVTELLELSRLESGDVVPHQQPFSPDLLLKTARQNLGAAAEAKGLDLGVVLAADVPELVNGDYNLVQRLLTILGGNAVKFTERGHITLAAEKQSQTDHQLWLLFSVSDTGIGIPEENREALFRDFTQIDGSLTRRHGGVGLGLTMARRLVDLLGGRMGVEANPEGGTTFHFSLPFQPTEEVLPE